MEPLNLNYLLLIWGNLLAFMLTLTNIIKQFLIWIIFALTWKKWKIMFILCSSLPSRLVAFPLGRWYSAFWPVNRKHKWGEAEVQCCSVMGPWWFGSLSPRSCLCWAHSRPVAMHWPDPSQAALSCMVSEKRFKSVTVSTIYKTQEMAYLVTSWSLWDAVCTVRVGQARINIWSFFSSNFQVELVL